MLCTIDDRNIIDHAAAGDCPLGKFTEPQAIARPSTPRPISEWPMTARIIAKLRSPEDGGIGDTIHRHLSRFGADAMTRLYTRIVGTTCGCSDRQERLNQLFRYAPG